MTVRTRLQFPQELNFVAGMDIGVLTNPMCPLTLMLYYCLKISGSNKTGRPMNDKQMPSALEVAAGRRGRGHGHGGRVGGRGRAGGHGEEGRGRGNVEHGYGRGRGRGRGR